METRLQEEVDTLNRVVYKARNAHRPTLLFRRMNELRRLCNGFLSCRLESKVVQICRTSQDVYILATANIPDGYFVGYTLIVLGLCARIHHLVRHAEVACDNIDEMFAEIE